jgi:hypothetical protein
MKKSFILMLCTLMLVLSFALIANAATFEAETIIEGIPSTVYVNESYTLTASTKIAGTLNVNKWTKNNPDSILMSKSIAIQSGYYVSTASYTAPSTPGQEVISYIITMTDSKGNVWEGKGEISVTIIKEEPIKESTEEILLETFPAAPAVAGKLLKEAGIKPQYGGGNYISHIASFMGSGTDFLDAATGEYISKDSVVKYEQAVKNYLISLGVVFSEAD